MQLIYPNTWYQVYSATYIFMYPYVFRGFWHWRLTQTEPERYRVTCAWMMWLVKILG